MPETSGTLTVHVIRNDNPLPQGTANPFHAVVPTTDDTLEFHAEDGFTFDGDGIQFQSAQAPYTNRVVSQDHKKVTFSVDHDPERAGIQWAYHIFVTQGPMPFVIDPTVENDPIPPDPKS